MNNLAILLGAGFSKWAADLPLGSQLFDFAIEPFGIREQKRLERVKVLKENWDKSNQIGLAEQFIAEIHSSGNIRDKNDVDWYIVRRLSEPYIWEEWFAGQYRRHVLMIDETRKWDRPGVKEAAAFISYFSNLLSGIVTLNYDLLIEYALGSRGFNYGLRGEELKGRGSFPFSHPYDIVILHGGIPIAKLHGSTSWEIGNKYSGGRRGISGKALIVAPIPNKEMIDELRDQWILSANIFNSASYLIVFGFGFNVYDQQVLNHLKKEGKNITEIAIVDVQSHEEDALKIWPNASVCSFKPTTEGLKYLREWFNYLYSIDSRK